MTPMVRLPLAVAMAASLGIGLIHRRLPPPTAARLLTLTAVSSASAVAWGLAIAVFAYLSQVPWIAARAGWCHVLLERHHRIPAPIGIISGLALCVGIGRALLWQRHCQRVAQKLAGDGAVEVVAMEQAAAFAVPGRPGHIVVSQAMLDCLDHDERAALLAHEQAHLDHHHHRYVRLADAAAQAVPLVHPLRNRVRFCTERWADEVAAEMVGDRRVVATAIARAAIARSRDGGAGLLDLAGHGVVERVDALLHPQRHGIIASTGTTAALLGAVTLAMVGATLQLQQLFAFATHVCQI